jgi:hypothetical protein
MSRFEDANEVAIYLANVREREGANAALEAAKLIIAAAAALITYDHGPDEARRILQIIGEAQGRGS